MDIDKLKEKIAISHGYRDDILGTAWEFAMSMTYRTKAQLKLYDELVVAVAKKPEENSNTLPIDVVSNRFVIRDYTCGELHDFDNYDDAKTEYDEIHKKTIEDECDMQLYLILHDVNNVD